MIQDDWTIDYAAKTLTHTAGTTVYTVNALYSWLMDVFDDAGQMDDTVPMTAQTPSAYTLVNGWTIPDASYPYLKGGAITDQANGALWANIYTLGTIVAGAQIYLIQNGAEVPITWGTGHIDILVKVKAGGVEIDDGILLAMIRDLGSTFDHFQVDCSAGGRNAVPLATAADLNNLAAAGTIAGWSDIAVTFGAVSKDLNNGAGARDYDVVIDCATRPLAQVYQYLKYLGRRDSAATLDGAAGEQYLAADPAYTQVKAAPFGTFAGGTFFGARGVWIENMDAADAKAFQLLDASGTTQAPPNTVAVKVTGVEIGDRVAVFELVAPGGAVNKSKYLAAAGNTLGLGTLTVQEAIEGDTPAVGTVRIGSEVYAYTGWSGSVFTLAGTLSAGYAAGAGVYVPLIDLLAAATTAQTTLIYAEDIPVLVRVRKKGILPFEVESTVTSTGMSVAAIRTADNIVTA